MEGRHVPNWRNRYLPAYNRSVTCPSVSVYHRPSTYLSSMYKYMYLSSIDISTIIYLSLIYVSSRHLSVYPLSRSSLK